MTVLVGPSERQVDYILSLLKDRDIDPDLAQTHRENLAAMDKRQASSLIESLLRLPRLPKVRMPNPLQTTLSAIQKSKYAVPVSELSHIDFDFELHGDLLFIEVREYMGTLYMRRLTGSLGGFTRHKMSSQDVMSIVSVISKDAYKYVRLFGTHYSCCGSCGAELTDPESRSLQLGPECRKKFGL